MPEKKRNRTCPPKRTTRRRKPAAPRNRKPTTQDTPENQARQVCASLLKTAASQARRGEPRLLAEILAYLKPPPPRPVIILPPGYADLTNPKP